MWLDLLFALMMVSVGFVSGWMLNRMHRGDASSETEHAQQALAKLRELAFSVAADVGEHTRNVMEISSELSTAKEGNGEIDDLVLSSVANIIKNNERLQGQLASAESRLQQQAAELETQLAVARTDALTTLNNRRAFDDDLNRRFAEWQRRKTIFSLLLLDVDHFKKFNDTHGHQAGDAVLKGVAATLKQTMREMDIVSRYGGEEFAAILPVTNLQEACRAAERARAAVEAAMYQFEDQQLRVTISVGAAQILTTDTTGLLIKRADEALYASKGAGRNCVQYHDGQQCLPGNVPAETAAETAAETEWKKTGSGVMSTPKVAPATPHNVADMVGFRQHLTRRLTECRNQNLPLSFLLVDFDQYKEVHDRQGAAQAELACEALVMFLATLLSPADILARLSKGQLAVMLPGASLTVSLETAERVRLAIADSPLQVRGTPINATASLGLTLAGPKDDLESLLKQADVALFASKAAGKNCTHQMRDGSCEPVPTLAASH